MTNSEKLSQAIAAAKDAEDRDLTEATQNRRWRTVFTIQDAIKTAGGWA